MLDQASLEEATRTAAGRGYARVGGVLASAAVRALVEESQALDYEPLEPVIGRVRQGGTVARAAPHDPSLPILASLARDVQAAVRRSGIAGSSRFIANEAMLQRYSGSSDGISPHRDQGFYRLVVVVFTLEGRAPFAILDRVTEQPLEEWLTEPGDMCVLAGGGLTESDRRPLHRVGPPVDGSRTSLTLRMKQRQSARHGRTHHAGAADTGQDPRRR